MRLLQGQINELDASGGSHESEFLLVARHHLESFVNVVFSQAHDRCLLFLLSLDNIELIAFWNGDEEATHFVLDEICHSTLLLQVPAALI